MKLDDFDYDLPASLIAQQPVQQRDQSRLMVIKRSTCEIVHTHFSEVGAFLPPRAVLVVNDTKVIPARLLGEKIPTGAQIEVLLIRQTRKDTWQALIKPGRRVTQGTSVTFGDGQLVAKVLAKSSEGLYTVRLKHDGSLNEVLSRVGQMPLPPYIKRAPTKSDQEQYQCVYAAHEGAVAAPTAGLHFTRALLTRLQQQGIEVETVTLHVGLGTFQPVKVEDIERHNMHAEQYELSEATAQKLNTARKQGRKIVVVGTTSVRVLETVAAADGVQAGKGETDIFIYPGYQFKAVDALITNFHLPKSTLLMLVSAFAGREFILNAYREAIAQKYRFYSYGDAMLIL